jgi:hypothetical protein
MLLLCLILNRLDHYTNPFTVRATWNRREL